MAADRRIYNAILKSRVSLPINLPVSEDPLSLIRKGILKNIGRQNLPYLRVIPAIADIAHKPTRQFISERYLALEKLVEDPLSVLSVRIYRAKQYMDNPTPDPYPALAPLEIIDHSNLTQHLEPLSKVGFGNEKYLDFLESQIENYSFSLLTSKQIGFQTHKDSRKMLEAAIQDSLLKNTPGIRRKLGNVRKNLITILNIPSEEYLENSSKKIIHRSVASVSRELQTSGK